MRSRSLFCLVLCALGVLLAPQRAHAFERQWHVGGGLGATAYTHYYSLGPAVGVNGAYGISDVFDLKVELLGSYHGYEPGVGAEREHAQPLSLAAGLSYKLDVLQWIPYGALLVGYQHVLGRIPNGEPFRRDDALAAVVLGLDYAVSRDFGLGASVRGDFLLSDFGDVAAITPMLRAEYHWGF